jgi:hypothetical protein
MAQSETIAFKGSDIEAKELTVAQLDDIITEMENKSMSVIDRVFNREMVSESMLIHSTGLSAETLRSVAPSELRPLVEAFSRVNADFLSGAASLVKG